MCIWAPVAGLRPSRAARTRGSKEPKPVKVTLLPRATCVVVGNVLMVDDGQPCKPTRPQSTNLVNNGIKYCINNRGCGGLGDLGTTLLHT